MSDEVDEFSNDDSIVQTKPLRYRDLVAYWILGLCNNFGYVVMLSAAHDILSSDDAEQKVKVIEDDKRQCNQMSTGAILLADIIPCLTIKLLCPFLPPHVIPRVVVACIASVIGFLLVGFANSELMGIIGVCFTSFSSGLGESSLLAYSSFFHRDVISTWSSGTGGAGIFGALSYAGLLQMGVSPKDTMLVMIIVPCLMLFTFTVILSKPMIRRLSAYEYRTAMQNQIETASLRDYNYRKQVIHRCMDKMKKMPQYFKYMIPLTLVYLFEYFINQGLFELVEYRNFVLDHEAQYRWLNFTYQVGVFISRSSVNVFHFTYIWIVAVLQLLNILFFLTEVIWFWVPSYWIVFAFTIWEGLLGGGAYVNTYYKMTKEIPQDEIEFAMMTVSPSDSFGITFAGLLSMPVHNAICRLKLPTRKL